VETVAKISLEFNGKFLYTMPAKRSASLKNSFGRCPGKIRPGEKKLLWEQVRLTDLSQEKLPAREENGRLA